MSADPMKTCGRCENWDEGPPPANLAWGTCTKSDELPRHMRYEGYDWRNGVPFNRSASKCPLYAGPNWHPFGPSTTDGLEGNELATVARSVPRLVDQADEGEDR